MREKNDSIDRRPDSVFYVYPDEMTARKNSQDRIIPITRDYNNSTKGEIMEIKEKLTNKLEKLKYQYGESSEAILTEQAYHACDAYNDKLWKCNAIKINEKIATMGFIYWDFSDVKNYYDIDDAANFPWDIDTDFDPQTEYNLENKNDIDDLLEHLDHI